MKEKEEYNYMAATLRFRKNDRAIDRKEFKQVLFFKGVSASQQNCEERKSRRNRKFLFISCPCTHRDSSIFNIPHQSSTLVAMFEPTLASPYHPESIVYIMVHSWCCMFCGFGNAYNDIYPHLWYHTVQFHYHTNPVLCLFIPPS